MDFRTAFPHLVDEFVAPLGCADDGDADAVKVGVEVRDQGGGHELVRNEVGRDAARAKGCRGRFAYAGDADSGQGANVFSLREEAVEECRYAVRRGEDEPVE